MLRITRHDSSEALTLQVEGRLVGDWAKELENCWKSTAHARENRAPIIDLTEVLFIDEEGKRVLTKLFREGAFFRTAGPMTDAILLEITGKSKCILRGAALPVMLLMMVAIFAKASEPPPLRLTLRDAVQMALKQNPQVRVANLNVAVSQEGQVVARFGAESRRVQNPGAGTVTLALYRYNRARADLAHATGQMESLYAK